MESWFGKRLSQSDARRSYLRRTQTNLKRQFERTATTAWPFAERPRKTPLFESVACSENGASDPAVSLDLLVRALLAAGAKKKDIAKAIAMSESRAA